MLLSSLNPTAEKPIPIGRITVVVGPTNSGKSRLLREVARLMATGVLPSGERGKVPASPALLSNVGYVPKLSRERLLRGLTVIDHVREEMLEILGLLPDLRRGARIMINVQELRQILQRESLSAVTAAETLFARITPYRVALVDGQTSADLAATTPAGSPAEPAAHPLQALQFADGATHKALTGAVRAWRPDMNVRLDDSERIDLRLRLAGAFPDARQSPMGLARSMREIPTLDEQGEGVRRMLGVAAAVLASEGRVVLLDHFDGELHPRVARRFSQWLADQAIRLDSQLIVATNQRETLAGFLDACDDVTVLRLVPGRPRSPMMAISKEAARTLAFSPLIQKSAALDSLFHESAVAVDGVASSVVYEAAMRQDGVSLEGTLVPCFGPRGLVEGLRRLRESSTRSCAMAHLDIFQDRDAFVELVTAASGQAPPSAWLKTRDHVARHVEAFVDAATLSSSAKSVEAFLSRYERGDDADESEGVEGASAAVRSTPWDRVRRIGWDAIPDDLRPWVSDMIEDMAAMGIFLAPHGSPTGWLEWGASGAGYDPLARALELLQEGGCPDELSAFLDRMARYLAGS